MRYLVIIEYDLGDQEVIYVTEGRNAYKRAKAEFDDIIGWHGGGNRIALLKDNEDGYSTDVLESKPNELMGIEDDE